MAANGLPDMVRRLRRLADPQAAGVSDAELVERYARSRDETAFELLLWRHGSMVHGVCRRLLRRAEDAEDAFQATFLTLVRKAATIRRGASLGAWLYQVAYRVALRARARVTPDDGPVAEPQSSATCEAVDWQELGPVLDDEVRRLPARYRDSVILCYLEGRTHAEAARELRCPKGTVAIRLSRARKLLQARLTRRGITLGSGLPFVRPAPPALVSRTLRAACGGSVRVQVSALTDGAIRAMSLTRLKATAAVVVASAGLLAAAVAIGSRAAPPLQPIQQANAPAPRPPEPAARSTTLVRVPAQRDGQLVLVGTEIAPGEKVRADRRITVPLGYLIVKVEPREEVKAEDLTKITGDTRWRRWREGEPLLPRKLGVQEIATECKRLGVGDEITTKQLVALVDPSLAIGDLNIKIAELDAADAAARAVEKTREEAERRVKAMEDAIRRVPGSVTQDDRQGAMLTVARYREECVAARAAVARAQREVAHAYSILKMHESRSPVSGVVTAIEKEQGDPVKVLDTVVRLAVVGKQLAARPGAIEEKERIVPGVRDGVLLAYGLAAGKGARTLREGDTVEPGALLARLDDGVAREEIALKESQVQSNEAAGRVSAKVREEAEHRVAAMEASRSRVPGSVSEVDYQEAILAAGRRSEEEIASQARVKVAQAELERAKIALRTFEIRSPVRGVVRQLLKVPGEAVRSGEPLIRLAVQAE
jgi:RNA polymerase sigma factor (sigma-70 family)